MFSAFRMGPAASGGGLRDIEKWEVLAWRKYADYNLDPKSEVIGIFSCKDFPIFCKSTNTCGPHDLMIINETDFRSKTSNIHDVFDFHSDWFDHAFSFGNYDLIAYCISSERLIFDFKQFY